MKRPEGIRSIFWALIHLIYWRIHESKSFFLLLHSFSLSKLLISLFIIGKTVAIPLNTTFWDFSNITKLLFNHLVLFWWGTPSFLELSLFQYKLHEQPDAVSEKRKYNYHSINHGLFTGIWITKIKQYNQGIGNCESQTRSRNGDMSKLI